MVLKWPLVLQVAPGPTHSYCNVIDYIPYSEKGERVIKSTNWSLRNSHRDVNYSCEYLLKEDEWLKEMDWVKWSQKNTIVKAYLNPKLTPTPKSLWFPERWRKEQLGCAQHQQTHQRGKAEPHAPGDGQSHGWIILSFIHLPGLISQLLSNYNTFNLNISDSSVVGTVWGAARLNSHTN